MRDAGRYEHTRVGVVALLGLTEIEDLRRPVGRAPDAKIVEHDAGPAERHVPVVGLM